MEFTWYFLSLISFMGFGLQAYLYKEAALRSLRSRTIVFWFALLTCSFLWIYVLLSGRSFQPNSYIILLGCFDALSYYISSVTRIEALKFIPGHLAFLILRANIIFIYIYAASFLGEQISAIHILAFLLLIIVAWLIHRERAKDQLASLDYRKGLSLIIIATLMSATTHVISKYAGQAALVIEYMTMANSLMCVFALFEGLLKKEKGIYAPTMQEFTIAFLAGIVNLVSWASGLIALRTGPLSVISFVMGMSFIIPIILSSIIHGEKPSITRVLAILIAVLTLFLLKLA